MLIPAVCDTASSSKISEYCHKQHYSTHLGCVKDFYKPDNNILKTSFAINKQCYIVGLKLEREK